MTKKDYELIASALRGSNNVEEAVARIAEALASDNPRFDRGRFVAACQF